MKPIIKWAGGKTKLLDQYRPRIPKDFGRYYEPFFGGGALFWDLLPQRAAISDANPHLIEALTHIKWRPDPLICALERHQKQHSEEHYYRVRAIDPLTLCPAEAAARFIYLNKTCFNGLYRENAKGQFNVPIGHYKNPCICDPNAIYATSKALQNATIACQDFAGTTKGATVGDLVFFDPPYHLDKSFNYKAGGFSPQDQIRLRDLAIELRDRGVNVMLSNSDCAFIRELYADFRIIETQRPGNISSDPKKRGPIAELLVLG
jgi:DNA adenine methylase